MVLINSIASAWKSANSKIESALFYLARVLQILVLMLVLAVIGFGIKYGMIYGRMLLGRAFVAVVDYKLSGYTVSLKGDKKTGPVVVEANKMSEAQLKMSLAIALEQNYELMTYLERTRAMLEDYDAGTRTIVEN